MTLDLPEPTRALPTLETGFYEGSEPSWVSTAGNGTAAYFGAGSSGGLVRLDTGTAAVGDAHLARTRKFQPSTAIDTPANILYLRGLGQLSGNDSTATQAHIRYFPNQSREPA